jgi:hypothetical protein
MVSPVIKYDERDSVGSLVEDFLIDLCVDRECQSDEAEYVDAQLWWVGKSIQSVKKRIKRALKTGEQLYKSSYSEILSVYVEFYEDGQGELTWRELDRIEI